MKIAFITDYLRSLRRFVSQSEALDAVSRDLHLLQEKGVLGPASGDLTGVYPSPSLVTSGVTASTYGNATNVSRVTVDAKGRVTAASNVPITGLPTPAALTRVSDTNVTLTLGGTPGTALLQSTSLTLGWSGTLAVSRGGTGVGVLGDLTRTNDTNVTLTLGGTPTGSLITSTSITAGWTGELSAARGGTGVNNGTATITVTGNKAIVLDFGTYTPTATIVANLDSVTAYQAQYMRIGSIVHVSGLIEMDATLTATLTTCRLDLPIASNLATGADLSGCGDGNSSGVETPFRIIGDSVNDAAQIRFYPIDVNNNIGNYTYTYVIK